MVLLAILVLAAAGAALLYNRLVGLRNQVRNAWRQIDVQLKRRHDLIPNLVEVVKDAMSYEQETLRQVVEARSRAVSLRAGDAGAAMAAEAGLSGALGRLLAVIENYPDLKANQNVAALMEELASTENKIAFSRQFYNDSVMGLNTSVESFPSNLLAGLFGFRHEPYFEIDQAERAVTAVDLR